MGFRMSLVFERKPETKVQEEVLKLYKDKPETKLGWTSYFSIWNLPILDKDLEQGLEGAISKLDNMAKGWKPVADGKETHYGMHGDAENVEFWYQRIYTR